MFDLFKRKDTIARYDSLSGRMDILREHDAAGRSVIVMSAKGSFQSATYEHELWAYPPFRYIRAFDCMFEACAPNTPNTPSTPDTSNAPNEAAQSDLDRMWLDINHVLMLGGGGFSYPKHLLTMNDDISVDVVELDPVVVDIARTHFFLDKLEQTLCDAGGSDRLGIFIKDAYAFLAQCEKTYDVIINDVYVADRMSEELLSQEGIAAAKHCLNEKGLYLTNVSVDLTREGASELYRFIVALKHHFANTYIVDACDDDFGGAENYIVIATDGSYAFSDLIPFD